MPPRVQQTHPMHGHHARASHGQTVHMSHSTESVYWIARASPRVRPRALQVARHAQPRRHAGRFAAAGPPHNARAGVLGRYIRTHPRCPRRALADAARTQQWSTQRTRHMQRRARRRWWVPCMWEDACAGCAPDDLNQTMHQGARYTSIRVLWCTSGCPATRAHVGAMHTRFIAIPEREAPRATSVQPAAAPPVASC